MTMKSVYIVYITNCFLWTMSDNKTHRILSYRIVSYSMADYMKNKQSLVLTTGTCFPTLIKQGTKLKRICTNAVTE